MVPLAADGEQYGFAGVRLLAERMQRECDHSYDLEKLVKDSGLVV